ncbi:MAG TPA: hypothetical protein VH229_02200 [Candidatus Udaeobacter sp.]|jgi:hypothetical protein|nr:hypothetical protein [Candidatus Udaeobacter sp.]
MKNFLVTIMIVLAGAGPLAASLGDAAERIDDAYGDVVGRRLLDDGRLNIIYHKDRYLYAVTFANGRSVLERYSRFNGQGLSRKEIDRFLKANAGGATWIPDKAAPQQRFKRSDGRAEATYDDASGRLALTVRQVHAGRGQQGQ